MKHVTRAVAVNRATAYGVRHEGLTTKEILVACDKAKALERVLFEKAPWGGGPRFHPDGRPSSVGFVYRGKRYVASYYHDGCPCAITERTGD